MAQKGILQSPITTASMITNTTYASRFLFFIMILSGVLGIDKAYPQHKAPSGKTATGIAIVSHRGANKLAPENTYAAAQKAIAYGAQYIEVDVRRSKDGVYYNFHDRALDRTTNSKGVFAETLSAVIDTLDAGSWFADEFRGERIPRIEGFLQWIKGKAQVYFDIKDAVPEEFMPIVIAAGMEKDCFFGFRDTVKLKEFREAYPDLPLKMNAQNEHEIYALKTRFNPVIIECGVNYLSPKLRDTCRALDIKLMASIPAYDMTGFKAAIHHQVDLANIDNPELFSNMAINNGEFRDYKLIAHRGGITEGKFQEFDPASIKAAIDSGYYMLEIDIRQTADSVLIVHHDADFLRFCNDPRKVSDTKWEDIKKLKATKGNYTPLRFEDLAAFCAGRVKLMIDVKSRPGPEFYSTLTAILEKYDLLLGAYFIRKDIEKYFPRKAKFGFRIHEWEQIKDKLAAREPVASRYFLFDHGNRLNSEIIKWCQSHNITVVPSVNIQHYQSEDFRHGAARDIAFLKACGVIEYQIDSDFDDYLPVLTGEVTVEPE
ncbi:MAG: hypothetical protein LRY55_03410 [Leadbetterella sp.]|nr:hypothetical protein [Leadbetterella sp.]